MLWTLKSKTTQPSLYQDTVVKNYYVFRGACIYVCVHVNYCRSKGACHTIVNYLNENHWQVRQVITECVLTYISDPSMQNWIFKKHIYLLSCLLLFIRHPSLCSLFIRPPRPVPWFSQSLSRLSSTIYCIASLSRTVGNTVLLCLYMHSHLVCVCVRCMCLHVHAMFLRCYFTSLHAHGYFSYVHLCVFMQNSLSRQRVSTVYCVYLCLEGFVVQWLSPGSGHCSKFYFVLCATLFVSTSAFPFSRDNLHRWVALSLLVDTHKIAHYWRGEQWNRMQCSYYEMHKQQVEVGSFSQQQCKRKMLMVILKRSWQIKICYSTSLLCLPSIYSTSPVLHHILKIYFCSFLNRGSWACKFSHFISMVINMDKINYWYHQCEETINIQDTND